MADPNQALQTQINNIEQRTGKSMQQLFALVLQSGLEKHMQRVNHLKQTLGMGHGDANTVVQLAKQASSVSDNTDPLDALYVDKKAHLRPIHDRLLARMEAFGAFDTAPKKSYISYRRNRQFTMIGPATNTRVDVGINANDLPASPRLIDQPPGRMCAYIVRLTDAEQVDDELFGWLSVAFDQAGQA